MLVVKGCRSKRDICGKLEFLLSNWDVSCIARRGIALQMQLTLKDHLYAAIALVNNKFLQRSKLILYDSACD